jgi:hypothetical protein
VSDSENFLARWSRLKRETTLQQDVARQPAAEERDPSGLPPVPAPFDPATLPSIELIDATTDIRPFLQNNVPEELTRAALRNTWSADPAIRDFVGIAENQWDFNDPSSIPGFGALNAADYLGHLLVQGVGAPESACTSLPEPSEPAEDPVAPRCSAEISEPTEGADPNHSEGHAPVPDSTEDSIRPPELPISTKSEAAADAPIARVHGGAMPQ